MIPLLVPAALGLIGGYLSKEPKKYHLGGDMKKHLAPNGKPSNLTHKQWHLVRTPEFKEWFGDWENPKLQKNMLLDENKEPKIFWHYGNNNWNKINKYSIDEITDKKVQGRIFLSPSKNSEFFYLIQERMAFEKKTGELVDTENFKKYYFRPFFVKSEKIKKLNYKQRWRKQITANKNEVFIVDYKGNKYYEKTYKIKLDDYFIIITTPTQLKLADGSNTEFDEKNQDVRYEKGGKIGNEIKVANATIKVDYAKEEQFNELYDLVNNDVGYVGQPRLVLTENNKIIGAIYKERYNDWKTKEERKDAEYKFDIVIKRSKRGKGYAKYLLNAMIYDFVYNYPESEQIRGELVNKKLQKYLEEKYEFSCDDGNQEQIMYCYLLRKDAIKLIKRLK